MLLLEDLSGYFEVADNKLNDMEEESVKVEVMEHYTELDKVGSVGTGPVGTGPVGMMADIRL